MTNVLIATFREDPDALVVANDLRSRGVRVSMFHGDEYPMKSEISTFVSNGEETQVLVNGADGRIDFETFDVVWWRRYSGFVVRGAYHPDDERIVQQENRMLARHLPYVVANRARWINPPQGEMEGASKLLQLRVAKQVGLQFPRTLATNSRVDAAAFIDAIESEGKRAILKTFLPHHWDLQEAGESGVAYAYASSIRSAQLVEESMFRVCPVLLQEQVDCICEIRAIFMGEACVAVEYNHARPGREHLGVRHGTGAHDTTRIHPLPTDVQHLCVQLMKRLSLVFGSFDFLLTADRRYVFLEVNPQGQWVWLESACAELNLVHAFSDFVVHGRTSSAQLVKS